LCVQVRCRWNGSDISVDILIIQSHLIVLFGQLDPSTPMLSVPCLSPGCHAQGLKLKPGQSLVSMTVLSPQLAQQVKAAQAAAADDSAPGDAAEAAAAEAAAAEAAAEDGSAAEAVVQQGPWLVLVTRNGLGKRVSLRDLPMRESRGVQGVIGIKLNEGAPRQLHAV
jgi:DNA gyrase/topoisomerase IV subunit A